MNHNKEETSSNSEQSVSKEAGAILLLSQQQSEFAATVLTALASLEATLTVNQNLTMTLLSAKGFSEAQMEDLKKQNREDYQAYRETFSKIYAGKLKEFQDHFDKLYAE